MAQNPTTMLAPNAPKAAVPLIAFSAEQAMLLESATTFCREQSPIASVRARMDSPHGFDRALWQEIANLGWTGIAIPEDLGGSGLTLSEVATIAEPMGRHLLATPFISTQVFTQGLLASSNEGLQGACLPRVCEGAIGTVALFEDEGDWDLERIGAVATRDDGGATVRLSGAKTLVCDAAVADFLLASVMLDGAPALAALTADQISPQRLQRETIIDETRRSFRLDLTDLQVATSALITGDAARAALRAMREGAWLLLAAEAAGGIAGVLDVTVDYLNLRTAFGRKIGSYQALKHTCAEILVALERGRSLVVHAATQVAAGQDAEVALRMAQAHTGDAFAYAGDRAVQFHGGFGFTWDCDAQLYLRRALWLQSSYGDAPHHRRRLAELLLDGDAVAA